MNPQLSGEFDVMGSDGKKRILQQWRTFRFQHGGMYPGKWVQNAFPELRTADGEVVDCEDETKEIFRIRGTSIILHRI